MDQRLCARYASALGLCTASLVVQVLTGYVWGYALLSGQEVETLSLVMRVASFAPTLLAFLLFPAPVGGTETGWPRSVLSITWFAGFVFLVSFLVGALRGNALRYLLGDAFRYAIPWITLYVAGVSAYGLAVSGRWRFLLRVMDWLVYLALFDACGTVVLALRFPDRKISTGLSLFGVLWALFQDRRSRAFSGAVFVICLFAFLLTGKRGNAIGLLVIMPFVLWLQLHLPRMALANAFSAALLLTVVGMVLWSRPAPYEKVVVRRFERLYGSVSHILAERQFSTLEGRADEVRNILAFYKSRPELVPFGAGFGLETPMKHQTGVRSLYGKMHMIHISWAAYFGRNGILGVILLLAAWHLAILRPLIAFSGSPNRNWIAVCLTMLLFAFVGSFKGNVFLEDGRTPLLIGLVVGLMNASGASAGERGASWGPTQTPASDRGGQNL